MLHELLAPYQIILASKSPRRKELLESIDLKVKVREVSVIEEFPKHLSPAEVALYLAALKATACPPPQKNEIWITSDTVVAFGNKILGKPRDRNEALLMLRSLSENKHEVITAVCIQSALGKRTFYERTRVTFRKLTAEELDYYIDTYKPFDKAGAYGIQDWIGRIAITRIKGCYYNVMGLPLARFYDELSALVKGN
ncbi:MAG TPA: Maf family nucleotide pyrophosphatase [Luteibaculaceae bacterium]|nr:Maf family nucleotide pyrophosphatase [Luteibaculaceae bacterium]